MLKLLAISFISSLQVIFGSMFVKNKRAYNDRVIHAWARNMLDGVRVKYTVSNPNGFRFDPEKPYIIMSNHVSHFDIPLIYCTFPDDSIAMIAKKELFRIPVFGRGMRLGGCVSIDRVNKRQAIKDLEHAIQAMLSGVRLWISPEGTRSATGEMGVLKKGGFRVAIDAKATIVPVTINGSGKILPTKTLDLSLDETVNICIGRSIDTTDYTHTDLKKLMSDTRYEIESNLK